MVSMGEVRRMSGPNFEITIVYTFYGQFERLDDIIKEKHPLSRVVIIDDCYPKPLGKLKGIEVYRVLDNILWNNPGAKNLGFHVSNGWIVYADIDHLVTKVNVDEILSLNKERGVIYFLGRKDVVTGEELDYWGTFVMHKDDFETVGGYDEDFSGHYGYDDSLFLEQCQRNLIVREVRYIKIQLHDNSHTKNVYRDTIINRELLNQKQGIIRNEGRRLNFNWIALGGDEDDQAISL